MHRAAHRVLSPVLLPLLQPASACSQAHTATAASSSHALAAATAAAAAAGCLLTSANAEPEDSLQQRERREEAFIQSSGIRLPPLPPHIVAAAPAEAPGLDPGPCLLSMPLSLMLGAARPLDPASLAKALPADLQGYAAWEASAILRGAALLLGPELQALRPDLVAAMKQGFNDACKATEGPKLGFEDVVSQAWALAVICGGLPEDSLSALQAALRALGGGTAASEAGLLLLLDAFLLTAAREWRRQHLGSQPAQRASLSAASPAPRPSRESVAALAQPVSSSLSRTIEKLYSDHVPLEGYFQGGALHTVLHSALIMPHLAADSAPSPSSPPGSRLAAAFGCQLPAACGPAAAAVTGQGAPHSVSRIHKEGARLRRDLQLHWRQDQLVDERQRAVNDMTHLLEARMGETVEQPADLQTVLPLKKTVIVLEDDMTAPSAAPPFTASTGCTSLERLCVERFCPPVQVVRAATAPGLAAARSVALESLGWRQIQVPPQQWKQLLPKVDSQASALRGRTIIASEPDNVRIGLVAQWLGGR